MQRLVTIFLSEAAGLGSNEWGHGMVEEHLADDLENGWSVVSMTSVGAGGGDSSLLHGWLAVVLERSET